MANKEFIRTVKFTICSISAGVIQFGLFTLMEKVFKIDIYWICYLTSLIASVLWNFTINKKVTFKSASNVTVAMTLVFCFYLVFAPVSTILGNLAKINGVNDFIVFAITMIANFVLEYLYTRYFVYRSSCDTAVDKTKQDVNPDEQKEDNNI